MITIPTLMLEKSILGLWRIPDSWDLTVDFVDRPEWDCKFYGAHPPGSVDLRDCSSYSRLISGKAIPHPRIGASLNVSTAEIDPPTLPTVHLMGLPIHSIDEETCIAHILGQGDRGHGGWVATPNLDHLRRLHKDSGFRTLCSRASLLVPDGMPLLWASRLQRTPLKARVAGSDLISSLSKAAAERRRSLFLLGGDEGTAEEAARTLTQRHEGLRVVGVHCPKIGFQNRPEDMEEIRDKLIEARPDIVFVALGSPKQEMLMDILAPELPETWWVGVGISFSFLCGRVRRAPAWMQRLGLEWVHRMAQEPRRLAKRYLVHGIPFALLLLTVSTWRGLRRRGQDRP